MKWQLLLAALLFVHVLYSQDKPYATKVIETLASSSFHGRGYFKKGDLKAARYIRSQFRHHGLQYFGEDYFQEFPMAINVITGKTRLWINKELLAPGTEYLVAAFVPSVNEVYSPVFLFNDSLFDTEKDTRFANEDLSGHIIITDKYHTNVKRKNYLNNPVLVLKEDKENLWWHVSNARSPSSFFVGEVKRGAIPGDSISEVKIKVKSKFIPDYISQNVAGYVPGSVQPDTMIVFTAHYDHLGCMGRDACFPGANDNASGTAMIMDLARYYAGLEDAPYYSMVFIALGGEEAGLVGARYCADNPLFDLSKVKFLVNLDMVGTGSDGITVVNGETFRSAFDTLQQINTRHQYLKQVKIRGESCNSDHCPFYEKGVPSVFIYSMGDGYNEYHTVNDKSPGLPLSGYNSLFRLLTDFVQSLEKFNPKH
ncbi:MAG: M28 family peptidase [Bacteroidetes bacterium]|nr:M28 family peptidase [Bacteroidota bacterium]